MPVGWLALLVICHAGHYDRYLQSRSRDCTSDQTAPALGVSHSFPVCCQGSAVVTPATSGLVYDGFRPRGTQSSHRVASLLSWRPPGIGWHMALESNQPYTEIGHEETIHRREEQIIGFLREAESGMPVAELCRKHAFPETSHYLWRNKSCGMMPACPSSWPGVVSVRLFMLSRRLSVARPAARPAGR